MENLNKPSLPEQGETHDEGTSTNDPMNYRIEELTLDRHSYRALRRLGVSTINEVVTALEENPYIKDIGTARRAKIHQKVTMFREEFSPQTELLQPNHPSQDHTESDSPR